MRLTSSSGTLRIVIVAILLLSFKRYIHNYASKLLSLLQRSVFEQRAKLYNLALEQSVARFDLNPRVLLLTLGAVKAALAAQKFEDAEYHVSSVTAIAREVVWSMLTTEERFAFNRYRRQELSEPVKIAAPTYTQYGEKFYDKSMR